MSVTLPQTDIQLSEESREAMHIASRKAEEYMHDSVGAPHLLWALLNKKISTYNLLRNQDKDIFYLQEWASVRLEEYPKAGKATSNIEANDTVTEVLQEADQLRFELEREKVDTICLLAALCVPGLAFTYDQLKTFSLNKDEVVNSFNEVMAPGQNGGPDPISRTSKESKEFVSRYCRDKHRMLEEQPHFRLVEREQEVNSCLEVLSRYSKANLIIIGEHGVGKSALIDGLANEVNAQNVPDNLRNARFLELDIAALQAGASYKGELEDRFQKILEELEKLENPVLVIEDIHILLDKQHNLSTLSSLLTIELSRNNITVIGTTSPEPYRKTIESDEGFSRRFESLILEEPDKQTASKMIREAITSHEDYHHLKITDKNITEAVRLAQRYDKEQRLPEAAIDLIDRCMARTRITMNQSCSDLELLKEIVEQKEKSDKEYLQNLKSGYTEFYNTAAAFLSHHHDLDLNSEGSISDDINFVDYVINTLPTIDRALEQPVEEITKADLAEIISQKTGIPTGKIQTQERKRLLGMEEALRKRVVGQDTALQSVTEAVLESRSGLTKDGQPIGSFFFLGPTGTGKTELAKALSEFLFQDEQAMIRFDMSEFKEEHSAALLYGSPPGYVGYEEGGMLVNKIRERPYSVVLFDEIEKAHASVFDIFLQILDEGKLTDRLGKEGDFSNAVILFTSNIASQRITQSVETNGSLPASQDLREDLSGYFRPEFLGRLTEIVPFAPISETVLLRIFDIHLADLLQATKRKGITIEVEHQTSKHLAQLGYSPQYGARPLKGVIRDKIRRPLSRMIIEGTVSDGDKVQLSLDSNQELKWNINN